MTAEQIFECSRDLVMTTEEDQLSIEDYVLFFKGAKEGKYGKILDRMDCQTVFSMLEVYRSERHCKLVSIKDEQSSQFKTYGDTGERLSDNQDREKELTHSAIGDYLRSKEQKTNE